MNPEVEWDATGLGMFGVVAHGLYGLALFWREWVEAWESYVYEMREYRDLGDWVLTVGDARAGSRRHPGRNAGLSTLAGPGRQDRDRAVVRLGGSRPQSRGAGGVGAASYCLARAPANSVIRAYP